MTWEGILKHVDEYAKVKIADYKEELKKEKDPELIKLIEGRIKYWQKILKSGGD